VLARFTDLGGPVTGGEREGKRGTRTGPCRWARKERAVRGALGKEKVPSPRVRGRKKKKKKEGVSFPPRGRNLTLSARKEVSVDPNRGKKEEKALPTNLKRSQPHEVSLTFYPDLTPTT